MKNIVTYLLTASCLIGFTSTGAYSQENKPKSQENKKTTIDKPTPAKAGHKVKISTGYGDMIVLLYDETPLHRDNFLKLTNEHFFDSLLFHRVIKGFMIQGGDPQSKNAGPGQGLGSGDVGYTIPAEFNAKLIHKKGALCAARRENPEKESSGCQFYIVHGKPAQDSELDMFDKNRQTKYTPEQRNIYKTAGGTPMLDMNYTVFGEVVEGLDVIDKIAAVQTQPGDRPSQDVRMKITPAK
ncbi:MAG TPA: peptidylprolyl isomerase [Bacteroidia bacterium]|nr:peptidylprolyl isomerase [Bacteroidia bacterium]